MRHRNWRRVMLAGALAGISALAFACSGGGTSDADLAKVNQSLGAKEAELAAAKNQLSSVQTQLTSAQSELSSAKQQTTSKEAELKSKEAELKAVQNQLAGTAPVVIIQAGQAVAGPVLEAANDGWTNPESVRGGLHLLSKFDSSGPDAWNARAHPLVYFTSEGTENESPLYKKDDPYFAGFHIIDAYSKNVVASALFTVNTTASPANEDAAHDVGIGREVTAFPHGVGISPDGKWAYVGWGQRTKDGKSSEGVVAIINTRTLKIDKLLKQESYYQGRMRSQRLHHIQSWTDSDGNDRVILQWGFGANGGPHHILDPKNDNRVVKSITYDDVMPMGHPFTTPSPDGKTIYISMGSPEIRDAESHEAKIAKLNLKDGSVKVITGVGNHPIGITHTRDGQFTYVVDGHGSMVYKIDNSLNEVVAKTSAGVAGPYGIALNWDETVAFTVGKGEGSHNRGGVLGTIDLKTFRSTGVLPGVNVHEMPIWLGGSASSVDHAILHPDPAVNELWVSNMNGWETIVVDLKTMKPKAWIPTPNGGNTHSGGFVKYSADFVGELMSDMGGPKSKAMAALITENVKKLVQAPSR